MRGEIHHLVLTAHALDSSRPFYAAILEFMGYRQTHGDGWVRSDGTHGSSIYVGQASGPHADRVHDRFAPGLHHLAFRAESREDVDRMHALLLSIGATILDPPADYPQYNLGRGYYAVFFADPDGVKLEFVHTP